MLGPAGCGGVPITRLRAPPRPLQATRPWAWSPGPPTRRPLARGPATTSGRPQPVSEVWGWCGCWGAVGLLRARAQTAREPTGGRLGSGLLQVLDYAHPAWRGYGAGGWARGRGRLELGQGGGAAPLGTGLLEGLGLHPWVATPHKLAAAAPWEEPAVRSRYGRPQYRSWRLPLVIIGRAACGVGGRHPLVRVGGNVLVSSRQIAPWPPHPAPRTSSKLASSWVQVGMRSESVLRP